MRSQARASQHALRGSFRTARTRLRTMRDLIRFGVSQFRAAGLSYGHGCDDALDEASYLVAHALHLPPDRAEPFLDAHLLPGEVDAALRLLQRRVAERRPAAYLTGEAWIGAHRFYVDERVIVPRSYIGHWFTGDLAPWIEQPESIATALELCTGSGCLAVLMALALPHAHIDALDVSAAALEVARRNVADYALEERIQLIESDLFARIPGRRYDLIVANPPYVTAAAMAKLPAEYRHEPALALAGGEDGLDIVRRILAQARAHLNPGGLLVMEVGHARERVEAAFPRTPFTWMEASGADDAVLLLRRDQLPAKPARR
ncbi:MAG: 50S ribosomal protein L3 N(5)-glutamine methyltransferase [Burkholderiales bacterium]|nr:50S ribosomal protein L3 N(5)-glutamine methyltransferase [Burkholderiales bacterium]